MRAASWGLGLFGTAGLIALALVAAPVAAAGSGYNLSYTATANSQIIASVDLVTVSTSYTSGPNLTADLTLAGTPVTTNDSYSYFWLFGGDLSSDASAWAFEDNGSAYLHSEYLELPESINYTLTGTTLSISVNITLVGSSSGFTFNGEASIGDSSDTSTYSWLGTDYSGSGTCTGSSCTGTGNTTGSSSNHIPPGEIIWPVVLVVVIVVVVVTVRRRRRAAAMSAGPGVPPTPTGTPPPPASPPPPPSG